MQLPRRGAPLSRPLWRWWRHRVPRPGRPGRPPGEPIQPCGAPGSPPPNAHAPPSCVSVGIEDNLRGIYPWRNSVPPWSTVGRRGGPVVDAVNLARVEVAAVVVEGARAGAVGSAAAAAAAVVVAVVAVACAAAGAAAAAAVLDRADVVFELFQQSLHPGAPYGYLGGRTRGARRILQNVFNVIHLCSLLRLAVQALRLSLSARTPSLS